MKGIINIALAASLVAGAAAQPHAAHQHRHRHVRKHEHGSPVEKRSPDVAVVYATPVVTVYEIDGSVVDAESAEAGIKDGLYSVVGETTPTFTPPAPSSTSTTISSSSTLAAQFFEIKSSSTSTSTTSTSTTPTPTPTTSSTTSAAAASSTSSSSSSSSGQGLDAEFPSGTIKCSAGVPTDYGAIELSWLGLDGWASIQVTGSYTPGVAISSIEQPTSGGCVEGSFCSYACPNGYDKSQWPETSQGATGQSIGGLYCNEDGYLELTRTDKKQLCQKGAGGVYVKNKLSKQVVTCKTNYAGDEKMSIPFIADANGGSTELTNPIASESYIWQGSYTTAQYYLNNQGVDVEDACVWTSSNYPTSAGNWAPLNLGVGQDISGTTWLSIFNNSPTSSAELDFDVEITGDVTSTCAYKNGAYEGGSSTGCTTSLKEGGTAYYVFS
ncbi:Septation protein SUN4 [Pleurostoma richardsiae]|uniref:Septation protein SUN4 n=1 Tax=Pleurostoma richardsiae TaxID=41990 RepID=A0AA38RTN2_9PEZI|nr:Septation protein SUN4 [Pleurostoma richardsiae]